LIGFNKSATTLAHALWRDVRGGTNFVEKVVLIALFVFAVALGVSRLSSSVETKFEDQGNTVTEKVWGELPYEKGPAGDDE
jgi:Flp pilus assembly pilin Flp